MRLLAMIAALMLSAGAASAEFSISFTWGDIPSCNTGRAKTVQSPRFVLRDVPAGTTTVELRLKDLDSPRYNHGGAKLRVSGSGVVPFGTFTYKGPCPPGNVHTYVWTATARAGNRVVGTATASRRYPE